MPGAAEAPHRLGPAVFGHGSAEVAAVRGKAAGDDAVIGALAGVAAADRTAGHEAHEVLASVDAVWRRHLGCVHAVEADAGHADAEGVAVHDAVGLADVVEAAGGAGVVLLGREQVADEQGGAAGGEER